ncbi:hypothetical protein ACVPOQ_10930 [Staphylococcus aureus]
MARGEFDESVFNQLVTDMLLEHHYNIRNTTSIFILITLKH